MSDYIDCTRCGAFNGDFWLPFAAWCDEAVSMVSAASRPLGICLKTHLEELTTFYVCEI